MPSLCEVTVSRVTSYADRLRAYKIKVDGVVHGTVRASETVSFTVPEGDHVLSLAIDWCGSNEVAFRATPGRRLAFECGSNLTGRRVLLVLAYVLFLWDRYLWLRPAPCQA